MKEIFKNTKQTAPQHQIFGGVVVVVLRKRVPVLLACFVGVSCGCGVEKWVFLVLSGCSSGVEVVMMSCKVL